MIKPFLFFVFIYCCPVAVLGQKSGTVKGILIDTLSNRPVGAATVSVLDKKDSSLVSFSLSDDNGEFDFTNIRKGTYCLLVTHVAYQNTDLFFTISDEIKNADLGRISMTDLHAVLKEVTVKAEAAPVTMSGDTIQYHAGSFKTAPDASVEQLLKKLPGIQVDKDGTVKAQGEKVTRVLVDGKEFFGKDPSVATKNLAAAVVDNVQVYNKQSDQAQLTGFEDGDYERTINLKLKADKKKGVFGELSAGAGSQGRFAAKGNLNSFEGARQTSVLAAGNNVNENAFTFSNMFGSGPASPPGGGKAAASDGAPESSDETGGINRILGTGINYNNVFGSKVDWQSSLFLNRYDPSAETYLERQNISSGGDNYSTKTSKAFNNNTSGRFNINALYAIDSTQALRFRPDFNYQDSRSRSESNFDSRLGNGSRINDGSTINTTQSHGFAYTADLMYWKKFRKQGRTFSLLLQHSVSNTDGTGSLLTHLNYYNASGLIQQQDTTDQQNENKNNNTSYNVKAVYSEPLGKQSLLEFSAGRSVNDNAFRYAVYDFNNITQRYDSLNGQQSGDFDNKYSYINGGLRFRRQERKYSYALGLSWQQALLAGTIGVATGDSVLHKGFYNFLPNARFQYNFTKNKRLVLSYTANTRQPTASQLQPVPDLSDALNILYGNPDLKQELVHKASTNLFLVNPYTNRNFFLYFSAEMTQHKIANDDSLDLQTGQRSTKPVNINGGYHYFNRASYSFPLRLWGAQIGISNTLRYDIDKQFINGRLNTIRTQMVEPALRLDISPSDAISLMVAGRWSANATSYSIQPASGTGYFSQSYEAGIDWQLPFSFFLSGDFTYLLNNDLGDGFNKGILLWNASLSKFFLKNNRGALKLKAFDLLNRNTAISRSASQNYIEDQRNTTLRQYFMLSVTYSLGKTGLNQRGRGGRQQLLR
ncbi:outer membrane beta-barrel protein [Niabella beijingensis]|uniref:outer membrane beta-barrel protein n=1 Tax=Niabella beijingensis TaxID=2872700 RepID=UPI001CC0C819|nr:outer membrane beta-barrel protein [Niabella beijingensis]MBZ4192559.1 outer membrane beta-barrel protein [Niabella beijingensis]